MNSHMIEHVNQSVQDLTTRLGDVITILLGVHALKEPELLLWVSVGLEVHEQVILTSGNMVLITNDAWIKFITINNGNLIRWLNFVLFKEFCRQLRLTGFIGKHAVEVCQVLVLDLIFKHLSLLFDVDVYFDDFLRYLVVI